MRAGELATNRARDVAARAIAGRAVSADELVFGPIPASARAIVEELRRLKVGQSVVAHRIGQLLIALQRPERLAELGARTFEHALEKEGVMPVMAAARYVDFATAFAEPQARSLTVEKGLAIVRYAAKVRAGRVDPGALVAEDAALGGKKISAHTGSSIEALIARWQEKQLEARDESDDTKEETDRAVRGLGAPLRKAGIQAKLRRVRRRSGFKVQMELDPDDAVLLADFLRRRGRE